MTPVKKSTLRLPMEDVVEILTSLETKIYRIEHGYFGPEEKPGENSRWIAHLKAIIQRINDQT